MQPRTMCETTQSFRGLHHRKIDPEHTVRLPVALFDWPLLRATVACVAFIDVLHDKGRLAPVQPPWRLTVATEGRAVSPLSCQRSLGV